jgi:hypothetical protein
MTRDMSDEVTFSGMSVPVERRTILFVEQFVPPRLIYFSRI